MTTGGYSSVSEYFRELVRQDQKRQAAEHLEVILLEGLNSGNTTEMTPEDWEDIRQAVRERITKHKGSNNFGF
ncbi:MAG: type II toxin-antitoxin system ParD family antitoxin [Nostoc sp.]|uniref:ribbon-helix-helix domain-containing protein n=1 Tax=Nostoc sp. TaxID=1180 RepID=UPI002FF0BF07